MNDSGVFWERVNAALDERRDPLSDERVQVLVAEDPTRLDDLLTLRERIAQVPAARPRRWVSRSWVSKVASLAAVALVAAAAAMFVLSDRGEQVATAPIVAQTPLIASETPESRSCVVSFRSRVVIESANSRSTIDSDGEHVVRSREIFFQPIGDDITRSQPAFVASIVHLNP